MKGVVLLLVFLEACSAGRLPHVSTPHQHMRAATTSTKPLRRQLQATKLANIAVVTTGGTIASVRGPDGTLVPAQNGEQLLAAVVGLNTAANITGIYAAARIDSSEATPAFWMAVAKLVMSELKKRSVDGVVVLHGSDTLEQTAWFLQCIRGIGDQSKPVVLTGAMRGADSPSPDGPGNIFGAATVAASPASAGLGVLVVFNDQVFSSRYVTKRNANLLDAFGGTNGAGRIGHVIDGKVLQYYRPNGKLLCYGYPLSPSLPDVTLQSAFPGADGGVITYLKDKGYKGAVIDGLGSGNIGAGLATVVRPLANATNFRVVITRTPESGITLPSYGCPGCLGALVDDGVIQAFNLNGFQARIVLMLALAQTPKISIKDLQAQYYKISYPYTPS